MQLHELMHQQARDRARAVRHVTSAELCRLWRQSGPEVRSCAGCALRVAYAQCRQDLLDELEYRAPEAFTAWLTGRPMRKNLSDYLIGNSS
ncbi:MAG: hypothetical protein ACRDMV_24280 [Streptosporangiales bacterium]